MSGRKKSAQTTLISNGVLEISHTALKMQERSWFEDPFVKTLLYTTVLKGAYRVVDILCSEVFNPSPVADTMQNLMFPN